MQTEDRKQMAHESHSTTVRAVTPSDAGTIAAIYNHYVLQTIVTFEEAPVTASEISKRIEEVQETSLPWLVAERAGTIAGYAYASRWRTRYGYRFSSTDRIQVQSLD
jgi:L-amino acid N-acyltransferase YncA